MYLLWALLAGCASGVLTAFCATQYIRADERRKIAEKELRRRIVTGEIGRSRRLAARIRHRKEGRA